MLRLLFLPRVVFSLAFLFLFCQNGFSQTSRPFRYSNEIGVDFAPFVRAEPGLSLLYKHGLGNTADIERRKRFALRLLLGCSEDAYSYSAAGLGSDTTYLIEGSGRTKYSSLSTGIELQGLRKNVKFYVGADLGYQYWNSSGESQRTDMVNGMIFKTEQYEQEKKGNVVESSILAGVQYFFLSRFSIGLEANVSAGMEFSNSNLLQNGAVVRTDKGTLFEIEASPWRLLYLSYHFGGRAQK